ncbi:MAG: zinc ribbon domain-containing protein [Bdellovibrionales bacterium]|nr:zinc ribbon domain-containing protein [Bdellovibrionales bacterium]
MMQECPRCGFSQPKDRFCANCGLDIENYHPAPVSWKVKLISSTWFQMSAVVVVIATLVSILYWKQSDDIQSFSEPPAFEDVGADPSMGEKETETTASNPKTQAPTTPPSASSPPSSPQALQPEKKQAAPETTSPTPDPGIPATAVTAIPNKIQVEFAEVPQTAIQRLVDSSTIIGTDGTVTALLVKNAGSVTDWVKTVGGIKLPGNSLLDLKLDTPVSAKYSNPTTTETESAPHFSFEVHMFASRIQAQTVDLDIALQVQLPATGSGDTSANLSVQDKGESLIVLAGFLPPIETSNLPELNFRGTPLEILYSESYASRNSDLLIIINTN